MQADQFQLHARIERRHWWFRARARIVRDLVEHLVPPRTRKTVVEVGCGTGGTLATLRYDYRCVGVDPDRTAVKLALTRYPDVDFRVGYAPDAVGDVLPKADVVLLLDVLEHVPDDAALLDSVVRSTKPGAHILATVPADMTLWSPHDEAYGHYRRYSLPVFAKLWRNLPVDQRLLTPFNTRLQPCVRAARAIAAWRGRSVGAAGTDLKLPMAPFNWTLERVFSGERTRLIKQLQGAARPPYRRGVSLITILKRTPDVAKPIPSIGRVQPKRRAA